MLDLNYFLDRNMLIILLVHYCIFLGMNRFLDLCNHYDEERKRCNLGVPWKQCQMFNTRKSVLIRFDASSSMRYTERNIQRQYKRLLSAMIFLNNTQK